MGGEEARTIDRGGRQCGPIDGIHPGRCSCSERDMPDFVRFCSAKISARDSGEEAQLDPATFMIFSLSPRRSHAAADPANPSLSYPLSGGRDFGGMVNRMLCDRVTLVFHHPFDRLLRLS